jgi:Flp pilus assembly protein TadG
MKRGTPRQANVPAARRRLDGVRDQSGQSLILMTIAMFLFIIVGAFALDVAQLGVAHHQAQVAADAAALSAAQDMSTTSTPPATVEHDGTTAAQTNVPNSNVTVSEPTGLQAQAVVKSAVNLPFGRVFGLGSGTVSAQAVAQVNTAVTNINGQVLSTVCSGEPCTYMANGQIPTDGSSSGWKVTSTAEEPTTGNYSGETSVNIQTCEGHQGNGQCYAPTATTASTNESIWVVDLNGESEGGMWQTVPTIPDARYVVNFQLTGNPALNGWSSNGSTNYFPVDAYVTDGSNNPYTPSVNEANPPVTPCATRPSSGFIQCGFWDYQDPVCNGGTATTAAPQSPVGLHLSCTTSGQEEAYFTEESLSFIAVSNETTITFNSETYDGNLPDPNASGDYWFYCGPELADITVGQPEIQLAQ